jgi:signal transduction histidine kinase
VQRTFQDITHPDDLATDLDYARALLAGERSSYAMEKRYVRGDGSVVWANLHGSLVRDAEGAPRYFIAVIEDISERKQAEAQIRGLNAALQTHTRALEDANRELEAFSYSVWLCPPIRRSTESGLKGR